MSPTSSTLARARTGFDPNSKPRITRFFKKSELERFYPLLELGDRVEFGLGVFEHFAIYVGPGEIHGESCRHRIVHFTTPPDTGTLYLIIQSLLSLPFLPNGLTIQMTEIAFHVGRLGVRINNEQDDKTEPLEKTEIVRRAEEYLLTEFPQRYSVFSNNCKHIVNYCRYNKSQDWQALFAKGLNLMTIFLPDPISRVWHCGVTMKLVVYATHQVIKYFREEDGCLAMIDKNYDKLLLLLKIMQNEKTSNAVKDFLLSLVLKLLEIINENYD